MIVMLETLAVREGWTTLADLAEAAGASQRTVGEDLSKLRRRWGSSLRMEVSKKNGVILRSRNAGTLGMVFTDLFNDSVALHWLKELLFRPGNPVEFYEKRIFTSRSTLTRLLPKINRVLSGKSMAVVCRNSRYHLVGRDEQYLRDFSACFLLEMYGLDLKKYDIEVDLKVIVGLVLSAMKTCLDPLEFSWISHGDVSVVYWIMFYLISLVREEQGYAMKSDYPVEAEVDERSLADLQAHFPHLTADNLRPIHQFIRNKFNGWSSRKEKTLVTEETEGFLRRFSAAVPVSYDEDTRRIMGLVLRSLYFDKKFRPYKTSALFDRILYFSFSLSQSNPPLYRAVEENLEIFSEHVKLDMESQTAGVLYWLCLACPRLCQFRPAKTALLIDDFGLSHARFLAEAFSNFFNHKDAAFLKIDIFEEMGIPSAARLENYDVILTTAPNLPLPHPNVLVINDYPGDQNFLNIYKALELNRE